MKVNGVSLFIPKWMIAALACVLPAAGPARAQIDDLLFIHHSCGENWLNNSLHDALLAKTYIDERNDSYYGTYVEHDAGRPDSLGTAGDNTDMQHWIFWFNDYLEHVKSHGCADGVNRIVMFKSCYPNSDIIADGSEPGDPFSATRTLANYRAVYRHPDGPGGLYTNGDEAVYAPLEAVFAANPDTLFIPVTAPPQPLSGNGENAARARTFNNWLTQTWLPDYNTRHPGLNNVAVFDWFNVLANPAGHATHPNRLRLEYGGDGDGHPNATANAASTVIFATAPANVIDAAWTAFSGGSEVDYTPPVPVTGMSAETADQVVRLSWTNPTNADWVATVVQRQTTGYPATHTEGTRVYAGTATNCTDASVSAGMTYYYTAFAHDDAPHTNWSAAAASARAETSIPGAPVTGRVTVVFQDGGGGDPAYTGCEDTFIANFQDPYQNVGAMEYIRLFRGDGPDQQYRMLLRFDLPGIPSDAAVSSATLELYQERFGGDPPPHDVRAFRVVRAWVEGTGTEQFQSEHLGASWEEAANGNAWSAVGGDYDTTTDFGHGADGTVAATTLTTSSNAWHAWDVTAIVRDWVRGTLPNHGLVLISTAGQYSEHYFYSSEWETAGLRPRLTVVYGATPPNPLALRLDPFSAGDGAALALRGLGTNATYDIQATTNLLGTNAWKTVHSFTPTGGMHRWTDPAGLPNRCYRLKRQ